jgi:AraC family transcriptional regulator
MEISRVAVERSISTMWSRYSEPLSLAEMAETATFSKFYFSRVFRSVTGTSPGRFLSAIRLYQAKQQLLQTSLSVTDIAYKVGYNSLGTFTSRFTRSVCFSPARYRSSSVSGMASIPPFTMSATPQRLGTIHGKFEIPETDVPVRVYVAAFNSPVVEGLPAACDISESSSGTYELTGIPDGTWFIRAVAVAMRDVDPHPWNRRPLFVAASPLVMGRGSRSIELGLRLRPMTSIDLPILLALPELDCRKLPEFAQAA